ncbi:MAG: glutamate--tRNA ligase [Myxococcota bacterium]
MSIRCRFAPSPTGNLHIGGARTALFNWLLARKTGGTFILRIEDTDEARSTPEYEAVILRDFKWLGIDWDEGPEVGGPYGPYRQSERAELYREVSDRLIREGKAYRCTCTVDRLEALRVEQAAKKLRPGYDGHCRELRHGPDCGPHVVRLRVPDGRTHVDDLFKGPVSFDNAELDDLVLVRSDGVPTYNFVVVVDDVAMKMTHVLRGEEHLNNTPKQLLVYDALGETPPRFGHFPLILGPDGSKLSKRHGATAVGNYRDMGFHPEALVNYLARLGWSHGNMELFSTAEILDVYDLADIGKSGSKWDLDKLTWVNAHWMKTLPIEVVAERAKPFFAAANAPAPSDEKLRGAVKCLRERARTLVELAEAGAFFFLPDEALPRDPDAAAQFVAPNREMLAALVEHLSALADWSEPGLEAHVGAFVAARGLKLGKVAQPVRVCVTGQKVGPGLYETLAVLGPEVTLRRVRAALDALGASA